jgi:hypothetical protein
MYVYGIHCDARDLAYLPYVAEAEYHMDYQILIFPQYTKATFLTTRGRTPTQHFWDQVRIVAQNKTVSVSMEDPYITEDEEVMVNAVREVHPYSDLSWFYIPAATSQGSAQNPQCD